MRIVRFDTIDSTSLHARREIGAGRLSPGESPVVFIAAEQSAGVGRFGRPWSSPRGGLWLTLAATLPEEDFADETLGLRLGVACAQCVRGLARPEDRGRIGLKWPNDVVIDNRKVLGVLAEVIVAARGDGRVEGEVAGPAARWLLVGAGLNANFPAERLDPELRPRATTLAEALGLEIDLEAAGHGLADGLFAAAMSRAPVDQTVAAAQSMLVGVDRPVLVSTPCGERAEAMFRGVDAMGRAVFERDGHRQTHHAAILESTAGSEADAVTGENTTAEP